MARAHPVEGLEPDRRLRPNARRILAVRIAEVYSYDGYIADPENVRELHDMRIAFKRLRYLLEIFGVAFDGDLSPFLDEVKARLDVGLRGDERVGVHGLIARRRQERNDLYHRFLDEWRRLKRERFRQRLEGALGIDRHG